MHLTENLKIESGPLDILTETFKYYAETADEKKRLTEVLKLCQAVKAFCVSNPEIDPAKICNVKLIEFGNNEILPSPNFINLGRI